MIRKNIQPNSLIFLMPESGFEPPTSSLRMSCSTELSYTGEMTDLITSGNKLFYFFASNNSRARLAVSSIDTSSM